MVVFLTNFYTDCLNRCADEIKIWDEEHFRKEIEARLDPALAARRERIRGMFSPLFCSRTEEYFAVWRFLWFNGSLLMIRL